MWKAQNLLNVPRVSSIKNDIWNGRSTMLGGEQKVHPTPIFLWKESRLSVQMSLTPNHPSTRFSGKDLTVDPESLDLGWSTDLGSTTCCATELWLCEHVENEPLCLRQTSALGKRGNIEGEDQPLPPPLRSTFETTGRQRNNLSVNAALFNLSHVPETPAWRNSIFGVQSLCVFVFFCLDLLCLQWTRSKNEFGQPRVRSGATSPLAER